MTSKQNINIKKISEAINDCHIISSSSKDSLTTCTITSNVDDLELCSMWPKVKIRVPDIFLHKPADFGQHVHKLLSMGIKFNQPYLSRYHTKITCPTFDDQKALIKYFENKQLPYHTFGHPTKRKMKVVIRGLPKDLELNIIKSELKALDIPIIRVHLMQKCENVKDNDSLLLAVVPHNYEGKKILRVQKLLGYDIKMEPPKSKTKQCHRCQMWGHTQRYCHGRIKCVKCAGEHLSRKCERDSIEEPPKCANCGGEHTASYRQCPCCPDSTKHKLSHSLKLSRMQVLYRRTDLVTLENCDKLYKNSFI